MALSDAERFITGARMFDATRRMVLASLPTELSDNSANVVFSSAFTANPYHDRPKVSLFPIDSGLGVYVSEVMMTRRPHKLGSTVPAIEVNH